MVYVNSSLIGVVLVGKPDTRKATRELQHVVIPGEHEQSELSETFLHVDLQIDGIDAGEIAGSGGLDVGLCGIEGEGEEVDVGGWDVGAVLVGLDKTEVACFKGRVPASKVVQHETNILDGVISVFTREIKQIIFLCVALTSGCPNKFNDRMIKRKLDIYIGGIKVSGLVSLMLHDELVVLTDGKAVALLHFEEYVLHIKGGLQRIDGKGASSGKILDTLGTRGNLDKLVERGPLARNLHAMKLKRNHGECKTT